MDPAELPLRDIHLPDAVGWWPPAPGWWLVAVLAAVLVAWALSASRRRRSWMRSPVHLARLEFERVRDGWREHGDAKQLARELSTWLRRAGMSLQSRRETASLTGAEWWRHLDRLAGTGVFGPDGGRLLTEAPYRRAADADGARLLTLCERWLNAVSDRQRRARR